MKKLLFAFVALAAISFASCGETAPAAATDSDSVAAPADSVAPADSAAADTTAQA